MEELDTSGKIFSYTPASSSAIADFFEVLRC